MLFATRLNLAERLCWHQMGEVAGGKTVPLLCETNCEKYSHTFINKNLIAFMNYIPKHAAECI